MNFFDYSFIFLFFPLTLCAAAICRRVDQKFQYLVLIFASAWFYCSWHTAAPLALLISVCVNYITGQRLLRHPTRALLVVGLAFNLLALGYYKYFNFFWTNAQHILTLPALGPVLLPLAISFISFQQISYLVDCYRQETEKHDFVSYALFICFFPHLIAGPIVLQSDVLRQLRRGWALVIGPRHVALGLALYSIGLAKKLFLADGFAGLADPLFLQASVASLSSGDAWQAALAYTFQIYFDFSGYSDMAIGLAYAFGLRLPINFNSPYQSLNIAEFWRRWHITLSRFLLHYLYVPLGGNRNGGLVGCRNLLVVMTLAGLWHGASWSFVLWGVLHGVFLVIHRAWTRYVRQPIAWKMVSVVVRWALTFTVLVFSWVPFRAADIMSTSRIWSSMVAVNGGPSQNTSGLEFFLLLMSGLLVCLALPNSQEIVFGRTDRIRLFGRDGISKMRFKAASALAFGLLFASSLIWHWPMRTAPDFIYFNF